jgi:hypothetical protein
MPHVDPPRGDRKGRGQRGPRLVEVDPPRPVLGDEVVAQKVVDRHHHDQAAVDATGLDDLAVGEYVVVYASRALERMDPEDVDMVLGFYAGLEAMLEEASR